MVIRIFSIHAINCYIQDTFFIDENTSAPIVITLLVALISVIIKIIYDILSHYISRDINIARARKLANTVFKEISSSCFKIKENIEDDINNLESVSRNKLTIRDTNVISLHQVEKLDFELLHLDIHFPYNLSLIPI